MLDVAVKFSQAYLPESKKLYYLRTAHETELDIYDVAAKARVLNINVDPDIIVRGYLAAEEIMFYQAAQGCKIKTRLFNLGLKFAGEYDGTETRLLAGSGPFARFRAGTEFRKYIKEKVNVIFDGKFEKEGFIGEVTDEATGLVDETVTSGDILTIRGVGLKIKADEANSDIAGVYFVPEKCGETVKAKRVSLNEPRRLQVLVPALEEGKSYYVSVKTCGSVKSNGHLLKKMREMSTDFTLAAQFQA